VRTLRQCSRLIPLITLFVFLPSRSLHAQNGVHVIDSLNQRHGGPGPSWGFYYASCWGYVAPDGHEYALIGCYSGTSIIDLDATPIREVAYIPGANNEWKELKTWGHYAYAVSENQTQGLQIIDLSYLPDSAHLARTLFTVGTKNVSRSHTVTVADGFLYLNGGSSTGTTIYSLADPLNPTYVGEFQTAYVHDSYVRNDTMLAAAINGQGCYVVSLANKAAPVQLGLIAYTGSGTHNAWLSINGRYVFTTDEVGSTAKNMKVWDISSLPAITPRTPYTFDPATVIHNVHGRGNFVYVAHYRSGVYVANVRNPQSISTVGTYNTYRGGGTSASYAGCWGVYPYFPSGRWIASDTQTGLYVLRCDSLLPRTRAPLIQPANGDTIALGAVTTFRWNKAASPTEDPHYYQLHILGSGVDTLIRVNDTSVAVPALAGYQLGQNYRWHLWIRDEFTAVTSQDTFQFRYGSSTVGVSPMTSLPGEFQLGQNYPNPFNPSTTISFTLPVSDRVVLNVFNMLGEEITTLVDDFRQAGIHDVRFDASGLASGMYIYRITTGSGFSSSRKMVLIR
jgi:choice-of-anchor B domain-containing protein